MSPVNGEVRDGVLLLTLDRPDRLNALNRAMLLGLDEWIERARVDAAIRVVVVTGAGDRAFSAGADVVELADLDEVGAEEWMRLGQAIFGRLERLAKPVIAAINGYALGGGCELALACDLRFAADHARLGQPEITLANLPGWGGTQRLARLLGPARAKELVFSGEPIDAQTALRIGLVNRVDPAGDLLPKTRELAARLTAHASLPLALAKEAIQVGLDQGFDAGLDAEARAAARCCGTPEHRAAIAAFLARRRQRDA